jgi:hypothetical protein
MIQINKIEEGVAAIDIGSQSYFVAVANQPVRQFGTFTGEIRHHLQRHHAGARNLAVDAAKCRRPVAVQHSSGGFSVDAGGVGVAGHHFEE